MINSKECAAEDKPGYFIYLSQQKEKGIHMNTFLQSVQNLDGEILLLIQRVFKNGYADTIYENLLHFWETEDGSGSSVQLFFLLFQRQEKQAMRQSYP